MTLRIIHVGLGGWGHFWNRALQHSGEVSLAACVDASAEALALAQAQLKLDPRICYSSLEQALSEIECEAVVVTTALAGHVPVANMALAAGKHVLVEKPFAPTLAEAQQLVATAAKYDRILMVSQNYRFFPAPRVVAGLVRAGTLGPVGSVTIDFRRYSNAAPQGHRHYAYRHPLLLDMAIHHFDLMRMVLGQEPRELSCRAWNPPWSKFTDPAAAAATISFDDGAVVSYRGSWVSPAPQTHWAGAWRIECSGGEIAWTSRNGRDTGGDRVAVKPLGKPARRVELPALPKTDLDASLANFVQAIRTGQAAENAASDNLGSLALTLAAIESAGSAMTVAL